MNAPVASKSAGKVRGECAQCGEPLPADLAVAICPPCELRGALSLVAEPGWIFPGDGAATDEAPVLAAADNPAHNGGPGGACPGRFGDYELLEEIARGGMGIVYRARQTSLDRIVAVKMLLAGPLAGRDFIQRFRTEAAAAASLQHPNIVAIHEVGFAEGQHFFAMDYVEGPTLAQIVAKGALPARQAASYLKSIAGAIHFAHERGVLHRDLKPSNVLIDTTNDQPRVADFGLAKRLEAETDLTVSGQLLGSPNYMSPEQAMARRGAVGRRSDVYSLGAILYHLLTGRPPFQGETLTDVLHQVATCDPLAPHLLTPRVPRDVETICLKCLEKEPAKRYQSAQELADELERFLHDEPIRAHPVTVAEHAWRWCRRRPTVATLGGATVVLLLLVAIGSPIALYHIDRERQRADQNLYEADMNLAQRAWDEGDLGATRGRLQAHLPGPGEPDDRRGFEWYYFWNLCRGEQRLTLTQHGEAVSSVAFSPDGSRLATGSAGDGDPVFIWDSATGKIVTTLPRQNVISLAFAPDGRSLAVGGRDRVVVWNLETGHADFKREEVSGLFRAAFSPVGTLLVIGKHGSELGKDGGNAELWDYVSGEWIHDFPESGGHLAISRQGNRLATGNSSQSITIWDLGTRQLVNTLETGYVIALALSPDGQTLATSYWGSAVKLWDVTTGLQRGSLTNNQHKVWSLDFSPDGRFLATGGADQTVALWEVATLKQTKKLQGHGSEVTSVAFSPDGLTLASGSRDKTARLWSIDPARAATTVSNLISRPVFSADSQLVAAGMGRNKVVVWEVATLEVKAIFADAFDAVSFSADGNALVTRGTNYSLRTFDLATKAVRNTVPGRPAESGDSYAALSPDGRILVVGQDNGALTFSDAKTGTTIATTAHAEGNRHFQIDFSRDGKLVATAGREAETNRVPAAEIWEVATGKRVATLLGHTKSVLSAIFSPDGHRVATCGADDTVKFWDAATWKEVPPSLTHKEQVQGLAFSPNGRTLAAMGSDGTMVFWNAGTHHELASLKVASGKYVTFSPDGQTLAIWNWDGSLQLLRAPIFDRRPSKPGDN